ncbi:MAG: T9SS type A sorting domain-containing protein [Taibaiella sp.]|nr:T9SS type A sorting domain-containing protein [Taibaiella sp.]
MKKFLLAILISTLSTFARGQVWYHYFNQYADSGAYLTTVAAITGLPYVLYQDRNDNNRAKVKGFGSFFSMGWLLIDSPLTVAGAADLCFKIPPVGSPWYLHAAFQDSANGNRACHLQYNGISWDTLGASPFVSDSAASNLSLAIDNHGTPYLAYTDLGAGNVAVVKKFDGTSWVTLGAVAASPGEQTNTQLAVDTSGHVYIAYSDLTNGGSISVRTFTDTGWSYVGPPGFSLDTARFIALAISRTGTPIVAFADVSNGYKVVVASFDGTNWSLVGGTEASEGAASEISMVVDSIGMPYVAYRDDGSAAHPSAMSVRKFNGTSWSYAGSRTFTGAPALHPQITLDEVGFLYATYSLDIMPLNGRAYVDQLSYAIAPGFKNIETSGALAAWPNPAHENFELRLGTPVKEPIDIIVADATGRIVWLQHAQSNSDVLLNLKESPGIYCVRVISSSGTSTTRITIE